MLTAAMIDSGATALFISHCFIKQNNVFCHRLVQDIPLYNIDGSKNKAGSITHYARLWVLMGEYDECLEFLVTDLGPEDVVLGLPWLRRVNPSIDWKEGAVEVDVRRRGARAGDAHR